MSEFIVGFLWFLLFFGGGIFLAYQRIDLRTSTIAAGGALLAYLIFGDGHWAWYLLLIAAFALHCSQTRAGWPIVPTHRGIRAQG